MRSEDEMLLQKVVENSMGVAEILLPRWSDAEKSVLIYGEHGSVELEDLVKLVILDKIKFDESREVYTNDNDLRKNPQSKLGGIYAPLMQNAVKQGIFKVDDQNKVILSDSAKVQLITMQKERDEGNKKLKF